MPGRPSATSAARSANGPATPITRSGRANGHPCRSAHSGPFRKLDAVAVLTGPLLLAPQFSFRQMKDPHVVSFSPMHHWTEHNIRVHVFTCVLALQIAHLMGYSQDKPETRSRKRFPGQRGCLRIERGGGAPTWVIQSFREDAAALPPRVRLGELAPDMMRPDAETKQITHAIRMAAYNAETTLARALDGHYARARDEACALIREALATSGDSTPAPASC